MIRPLKKKKYQYVWCKPVLDVPTLLKRDIAADVVLKGRGGRRKDV